MELLERLADLRSGYVEEGRIMALVSYQPPVQRSVSSWKDHNGELHFDLVVQEEPAAAIGMSLSAAMVTFTAGIAASEEFTSYSPRHPIRQALASWERICRRRHSHDGPSCGELVRRAIQGDSLLFLARSLNLAYPRVERTIQSGMRYIEERLQRLENPVESLTA